MTGTYAVVMEQRIDMPDLVAEGVGQISGIVSGCWFSPNLVAGLFSFDGAIATDAGTYPFAFDVPFDGSEGSPGIVRWDFDDSGPEAASGSLATGVFLSYMRSVGVSVNDVEIRFTGTRTLVQSPEGGPHRRVRFSACRRQDLNLHEHVPTRPST